jgi:hypothetical protein
VEPEEFEHIPWSSLTAEHRSQRTKLLYITAALIAAVVVGFVGVRWMMGPQHGAAPVEPATAPVAEELAPVQPPPTTVPPGTASAGPITEADLMANESGSADELATMRAEWFVTDFFTVDGSPSTAADVAKAFVADADVPALPHSATDVGKVSYVEWARAYRTEAVAPDRYVVNVAFRSIGLGEDDSFSRGPVHAVEVTVVTGDGSVGIAELPIPIVPPRVGGLDGWWSGEPAGDDVSAAVLEYGLLFDAEPELIEATETAEGWRGVVTIGDGSGIRWPVAVRSDRLVGGS